MNLKFNLTNILLLTVGIFLLLLLFKKDNQIVKVSNPKTIINNIKGKENQVRDRETVIKYNEEDVQRLNESFYNLQLELAKFKRGRDTINIIHTQDHIIDTLIYRDQKKDTIINNLKLNVADLKYVSQSKDTLLAIAKVDLKKVKRQRNGLGVYALLMTAVAIIK